MVRIFVCTSQINALYMILYARATFKTGYKDVMILDAVPKRASLIEVLHNTNRIYQWHKIVDLSIPLPDEKEISPGFRKNFTRKIKGSKVVKPFYDFLLKGYLKKTRATEKALLAEKLKDLGEVGEINLLTQTILNHSLLDMYPEARVNYFEHGLGDYLYVQNISERSFNFYCLFAANFRKFLSAKGSSNGYVKDLPANQFAELAHEVLESDEQKQKIRDAIDIPGKKVIIFLDAVEIYCVPDKFWTDYLDLCISKVPDPQEYVFILKPHHHQTVHSIQISKNHMIRHHKLRTVLIEDKLLVNYGIEVLNCIWNETAEYAFSMFSSGLFYISKLYANPRTKYYYAYDMFANYIQKSPPQFVKAYRGASQLMEHVFSDNCTDISPKEKN